MAFSLYNSSIGRAFFGGSLLRCYVDGNLVSSERSRATMSANKERIEILEQSIGNLHEEVQRLGHSIYDQMQRLEDLMCAILDALLTPRPPPLSASMEHENTTRNLNEETDQAWPPPILFRTKLDCPRYSGNDDPAEWFNRLEQFFEFQMVPEEQRVGIASFQLKGRANQLWQWKKRKKRRSFKNNFLR